MGKNCIVSSCRRHPKKPNECQTFHAFPTEMQHRTKWLDFVKNANRDGYSYNPNVTNHNVLCSRHFDAECCTTMHGKLRRIKSGHCPSLLWNEHGVIVKTDFQSCPQPLVLNPPLNHTTPEHDSPMPMELETPIQEQTSNLPEEDEVVKKLTDENLRLQEKLKGKNAIIADLRAKLRSEEAKLATSKKRLENSKLLLEEEKKNVKNLRSSITAMKNKISSDLDTETPEVNNETLIAIFKRAKNHSGKSKSPFSIFLKEFAVQLQFKSTSAYEWLREKLQNVLPHPRSLQLWLSHVDATPEGFLKCSLSFLHSLSISSGKKLYCSVMIDEIHIRTGAIYHSGQMKGSIDYGGILPKDPKKRNATAALFIMVVGMNVGFKCHIGYILTNGLSAKMIKGIFSESLKVLHSVGVTGKVVSFDGLSANFKGVEELGANLNPRHQDFKPYFSHPETSEKVYVFPDPPHMIKLVRNAFEHFKAFSIDSKKISWDYFEKLVKLQNDEKLHMGNKITSRHVNFKLQKMKVKLAVQLLSLSVATSLRVLQSLGSREFIDSGPTADLIEVFDRLFDALNSHCKGKGSKSPLHAWNQSIWKETFDNAKELIFKLELLSGESVLDSRREIGFRGLLICIRSMELLMEEILTGKCDDMTYLTVYKLCQDHLEIFFSLLRGRLGFNNNPNVIQLEAALKRILAVSMKAVNKGNCVSQEDEEYPQVCPLSTTKVANKDDGRHAPLSEEELIDGDDDLPSYRQLSLIVNNVVAYISGFVGRKLVAKSKCVACASSLFCSNSDVNLRSDFVMLSEKNRGGLFVPSNELVDVCKKTESVLREAEEKGTYNLCTATIIKNSLRTVIKSGVFKRLREHESHGPFSDHVYNLLESIIQNYVRIRMHHVAKQHNLSEKPKTVRNFNTKMVLFNGQ